jgi:hypothetical protein
MSTLSFPASLHTPTPADGHALARKLAWQALAERASSSYDMASQLSAPPAPSLEALTAAYFQAVAAANAGWPR